MKSFSRACLLDSEARKLEPRKGLRKYEHQRLNVISCIEPWQKLSTLIISGWIVYTNNLKAHI
jgi:hypothetical protein